MDPSAPGWYPDPYSRHERRYWSGVRWSRHVEDRGHRATDPLDTGPGAETPPRRTLTNGASHTSLTTHANHTSHASHTVRRSRTPIGLVAAGVAAVLLGATAFVLLTRRSDDNAGAVTEDPLVVAVVKALRERSGGPLTAGDASCMADGLIGSVGADRLTELGVLDGTDPIVALDDPEREAALPRAFGCLDDAGMVQFMSSIWADVEEGSGLSPVIAPCFLQRLLDEFGRDRVIYIYGTFARPDPIPINETVAADQSESDYVADTLHRCVGLTTTSAGDAPAG